MEYNLLFYPQGSEKPTAAVYVTADDVTRVAESVGGYLESFKNAAETARSCGDKTVSSGSALYYMKKNIRFTKNDTSAPGIVVCNYGQTNDRTEMFFNEEDAIAAALYGCFMGKCDLLAVTIEYKGEKYTDIRNFALIDNCLGVCGVKFFAKKEDGESAEYYLLTKTVGNDYGKYKDDYIMQSPSTGIVKVGPELQYAGALLCYKNLFLPYDEVRFLSPDTSANDDSRDIYKDCDEDGNYIEAFSSNDNNDSDDRAVSAAHIFFERDGENFAFSVLIHGRLYKKISKTADAVTFYKTPLDFAKTPADAENGIEDYKADIVFKEVNGQYLNEEKELRNGGRSLNKAINTCITLPQPPEGSDLAEGELFGFYLECRRALDKAFENSKKYFTTKYQWAPHWHVYEWSNRTKSRFGTSDPPACQVDIERVDDFIHSLSYEGATITASASVPCGSSDDFEEIFAVRFPEFKAAGISFDVDGGVVVFEPNFSELNVRIKLSDSKSFIKGGFVTLKNSPGFDGAFLPRNLYFDTSLTAVRGQIELYKNIKDAIVKFDIKKCAELFDNDPENKKAKISELLYPSGGKMIPDENVISAAIQLENEFDRTQRVPNVAILGQAGTGKSTLAKNLAKIFGKEVRACTPSELRGAYVGHTKYLLLEILGKASLKNQILFVDEVYQLMDDQFGREAVTVLLPLMTGDQTHFEASLDKGQRDSLELDFGNAEEGREGYFKVIDPSGKEKSCQPFAPGIIPIWISGYDDEVRRMISMNQGLYRRLKKVVLTTPVTSDLLRQFNNELNEMIGRGDDFSRKSQILKKHFDENGTDSVKKFFGWGAQPQNSKYFASHAGVTNFLGNCIDSIDFSKDLGDQIENIIRSTKKDIRRQLSAIKTGSNQAAASADSISVITDIDTRFSDLVGCDAQIAYMQSIVDMLVNSVTSNFYDDNHLAVPKGALMEGLPGTGKTYIARAMAGELEERFQKEAPDKRFGFMSFSASELGGRPASYIASIFGTAEEYDACIVFIDEVDAIAKHRSVNNYSECYLELIKQMDGIEKHSNVFILAATNAPEQLDPAFVRSGRIDKNLVFYLPDKEAREILARKAIEERLGTVVNFAPKGKEDGIDKIVQITTRKTSGFTAGDIKNVINTAFITYHQFTQSSIDKAAFNGYQFIDEQTYQLKPEKLNKDIDDGNLRILCAFIEEEIERKNMGAANYSKKEDAFSIEKNGDNCSSTAIHEVGHAVVSLMLGEKPFETITIIPRGDDILGYVSHSELNMVTKSDFENRIRVCMGGRVAEELIYGKDNVSTGASNDMRSATYYARLLVEQVGLTDDFGFMTLSVRRGKYLGGGLDYTCSDSFREKSDAAVNVLLKKLYSETLGMLADRKELIESLAKHVFEKESMSGKDFEELYKRELKLDVRKSKKHI